MKNANVVYEMVTERILAELQQGNIPWRKPWVGAGRAYNYKSGRRYSLMNQMLLLHQDGYLTFKQAKALGGNVKKGAKAELVFEWFIKDYPVVKDGQEVLDDDGKPVTRRLIKLTYDMVFWIGDCENLPEREPVTFDTEEIRDCEEVAQAYVKSSGIRFVNDTPSDEAYYSPRRDKVVVPMIEQFKNAEEYYSTVFHEFTHSTGHKSRLNRFDSDKAAAFGSEDYSKEELVAEIGSASIMNILGHETPNQFTNSVAYIQNWSKALKDDVKLIVHASARAEKAVAMILGE